MNAVDPATHLSGEWTVPSDTATKTGEIIGTPAYMSPSKRLAVGTKLTPAAMFTASAMLYMLLTGAAPAETSASRANG